MRKSAWPAGLACLIALGGCYSDIVVSPKLRAVKSKCVYVEPFTARNSQIGEVLRDVVTKEFLRHRVNLCDKDNATLFVSGAAFLTERARGREGWFGVSSQTTEAIESLSLTVKDNRGHTVASASYDNVERFTASRLAREVGGALAGHLR